MDELISLIYKYFTEQKSIRYARFVWYLCTKKGVEVPADVMKVMMADIEKLVIDANVTELPGRRKRRKNDLMCAWLDMAKSEPEQYWNILYDFSIDWSDCELFWDLLPEDALLYTDTELIESMRKTFHWGVKMRPIDLYTFFGAELNISDETMRHRLKNYLKKRKEKT